MYALFFCSLEWRITTVCHLQNDKLRVSKPIYLFLCFSHCPLSFVLIQTSLAPTLPPPPVTPNVEYDVAFEGSNDGHDIPLVFFSLSSNLVVNTVNLDSLGSID